MYGIKQTEELRKSIIANTAIKLHNIDVVVVAPNARARSTFQPIKNLFKPEVEYQELSLVSERSWGWMMEKPFAREELVRELALREKDPLNWKVEGGESMYECIKRAELFINYCRENFSGKKVFVLSHLEFMTAYHFALNKLIDPDLLVKMLSSEIHNCTMLQYQRSEENAFLSDFQKHTIAA